MCNDELLRRRLIKRQIEEYTEGDDDEEEEEGEEVAMNVDKDESLRMDSQDLLSSDY